MYREVIMYTQSAHGSAWNFLFVCLFGSLVLSAPGADRYVSLTGSNTPPYAEWATAARDIQDAVDLSQNGDAVYIGAGTYPLAAELMITNQVILEGVSGAPATIVDGGGTRRCMQILHAGVEVRGLTIQNGGGVSESGGIYARDNAWIDHCIIVSNTSSFSSGGLRMERGGRLSDCTIRDNRSHHGGGLVLGSTGLVQRCLFERNISSGNGGGLMAFGGGLIEDCTIVSNRTSYQTSSGGLYGGGAFIGSRTLIRRCTVQHNFAGSGAGIYIEQRGTVETCRVEYNHAAWFGGGVYSMADGHIDQCHILHNRASNEGLPVSHVSGYGGGVYLNRSSIRNCLLFDNEVYTSGGGIQVYNGCTIENCTVANNRANGSSYSSGGGVDCGGGAILRNNIIFGNTAPSDGEVTSANNADIRYTCSATRYPGIGNFSGNPQFAGPSDHHLLPGSACLDYGENTAWMSGAVDLDQHPRIAGSQVDLGAYEFSPGPLVVNALTPLSEGVTPLVVVLEAFVAGTNTSGLIYRWDFGETSAAPPAGPTALVGEWDLEGPGLSIVTNVYETMGDFTVRLQVENAAGEIDTRELSPIVRTGPDAVYVSPTGTHEAPFISWAQAATNLQDAINTGVLGTRVDVADGVYPLPAMVAVNQGVHIRGVNGPSGVILDGQDSFSCIALQAAGAVVEGLTLRNGNATGGGGARIEADAILKDCRIINNTADDGGGVLLAGIGLVEACIITNNYADDYGGGVYLNGGGLVRNCMVNTNYSDEYGGGVYFEMGGRLEGGTVSENYAYDYGGGVYFYEGGTITGATIASNTSESYGGGCYGYYGGHLEGCTVQGNTAEDDGGGIYLEYGGGIRRCVFRGNTSYDDGGGIYADEPDYLESSLVVSNWCDSYGGGLYVEDVPAWNLTVVGNEATSTGGGFYDNGSAPLRDSIVTGNTAPDTPNYYGSDAMNSCIDPPPAGTGNFAGPAGFVLPGLGDYHLTGGSPCLDAGAMTGFPPRDLDGQARGLDGDNDGSAQNDVGAYETLHPAADSDQDGLTDQDESTTHQTNPARADTDDDGQNDGHEVIAGTDPLDPLHWFGCGTMEQEAGDLVMRWMSMLNRQYTVQSATVLHPDTWNTVPDAVNLPGTGDWMSYTNETPTVQYFLRLRVQQAP